jgi:hypothetical protein
MPPIGGLTAISTYCPLDRVYGRILAVNSVPLARPVNAGNARVVSLPSLDQAMEWRCPTHLWLHAGPKISWPARRLPGVGFEQVAHDYGRRASGRGVAHDYGRRASGRGGHVRCLGVLPFAPLSRSRSGTVSFYLRVSVTGTG